MITPIKKPGCPKSSGLGEGVLKKLVADVLDRVDQFSDFDPRQHYALTLAPAELSEEERSAFAVGSPAPRRAADIDLDLP